jgi:hypothetical protein
MIINHELTQPVSHLQSDTVREIPDEMEINRHVMQSNDCRIKH